MSADSLADLFRRTGLQHINRSASHGSYLTSMRRFKAHFGADPIVCAHIWLKLTDCLPARSKHEHLRYALLFLRRYQTEHQNAALFGVDEKTFRKHQWIFVELLATKLDVVSRILMVNVLRV